MRSFNLDWIRSSSKRAAAQALGVLCKLCAMATGMAHTQAYQAIMVCSMPERTTLFPGVFVETTS